MIPACGVSDDSGHGRLLSATGDVSLLRCMLTSSPAHSEGFIAGLSFDCRRGGGGERDFIRKLPVTGFYIRHPNRVKQVGQLPSFTCPPLPRPAAEYISTIHHHPPQTPLNASNAICHHPAPPEHQGPFCHFPEQVHVSKYHGLPLTGTPAHST